MHLHPDFGVMPVSGPDLLVFTTELVSTCMVLSTPASNSPEPQVSRGEAVVLLSYPVLGTDNWWEASGWRCMIGFKFSEPCARWYNEDSKWGTGALLRCIQ
jgi:hypothetical protein